MEIPLEALFWDLDNTLIDTKEGRKAYQYNYMPGAEKLIYSIKEIQVPQYLITSFNGLGAGFQFDKIEKIEISKLISEDNIVVCHPGDKTFWINHFAQRDKINKENSSACGDKYTDILQAQKADIGHTIRMMFGKYGNIRLDVKPSDFAKSIEEVTLSLNNRYGISL